MGNSSSSTLVAAEPLHKWPLEIRCLLESLSRPAPVGQERRVRKRIPLQVAANIRFQPDPANPHTEIVDAYLRDYDERAVAFVTAQFFAVGQTVELHIPVSDGTTKKARCTIGRCRQFSNGWFEGVLMAGK